MSLLRPLLWWRTGSEPSFRSPGHRAGPPFFWRLSRSAGLSALRAKRHQPPSSENHYW